MVKGNLVPHDGCENLMALLHHANEVNKGASTGLHATVAPTCRPSPSRGIAPLLDHVIWMHFVPSCCHQGVGLVDRNLWVNSPDVMAPAAASSICHLFMTAYLRQVPLLVQVVSLVHARKEAAGWACSRPYPLGLML